MFSAHLGPCLANDPKKRFFSHDYLLLIRMELLIKEIHTIHIYSWFRQAPSIACTGYFSASIMQTFFSLLFLIHYTLASDLGRIRPRAQEDHLADYPGNFPSDDLIAETPGNQLIISGDITGNNGPGFERQQQQQPQKTWLKSPELLLLAGGATAQCNNGAESIPEQSFTPRRFRRSSARHAKRQSKTFCTVPEPQKLQNGEEAPIKPKKKRPEVGQADLGYPGISLPIVQNLIMQIKMWGSIAQEPHEGVCGSVEVPICVPMLPTRQYPTQQQSFSHFVVPVRFCKFFLSVVDFYHYHPLFHTFNPEKHAGGKKLGGVLRTSL